MFGTFLLTMKIDNDCWLFLPLLRVLSPHRFTKSLLANTHFVYVGDFLSISTLSVLLQSTNEAYNNIAYQSHHAAKSDVRGSVLRIDCFHIDEHCP